MAEKKLIKASPAERQAFGARLDEAWKAADYASRPALAEALGVRPQTVQVWAAGRSMPKKPMLTTLAQTLGVSKKWLLTGEGAGPGEAGAAEASAWSPGAFQQALEDELARLDPEQTAPSRGTLTMGEVRVTVDLATPQAVFAIQEGGNPHHLIASVQASLWRLAVVRERDRWLGGARGYYLVLLGPGLTDAPTTPLADLHPQAAVLGLAIRLNPDPLELAHRIRQTIPPQADA